VLRLVLIVVWLSHLVSAGDFVLAGIHIVVFTHVSSCGSFDCKSKAGGTREQPSNREARTANRGADPL